MSKKKRKRRSFVPESEAKNAVKKSFQEFNWKLAGKLALSFAIVFSLYHLLLWVGKICNSSLICDITVIAYVIATSIFAAAFIIQNRGISNDIPAKDQLRDEWTDEEKEKYIEELIESKKKAKNLLIIFIPLVLTLLIDTIYLILFVK